MAVDPLHPYHRACAAFWLPIIRRSLRHQRDLVQLREAGRRQQALARVTHRARQTVR